MSSPFAAQVVRRRQLVVSAGGCSAGLVGVGAVALGLPAVVGWVLLAAGAALAGWALWWFGLVAAAAAEGPQLAALAAHRRQWGPVLLLEARPMGRDVDGVGALLLLVPAWAVVPAESPVTVCGFLPRGVVAVSGSGMVTVPLVPGWWTGRARLTGSVVRDRPT